MALELFTRQGYESTSLRQIADALGINKASLYYHFSSKEEILRSLFEDRGSEAAELVAWIDEQPQEPDLLERAVLRWVDSFSEQKLHGIRFMLANPLVSRVAAGDDGERIGARLNQVAERLASLLPAASTPDVLVLRMALLSINAAVEAAAGTDATDTEIVSAARASARALIGRLLR